MRVLVLNHTTIVHRLLPGGLSAQDGGNLEIYQVKWPKLDQAHRLVFGRVELQHLLQRELSTDVAVHDDKGIWTPSSDLVTEVVEASSCAKRSVFLQISHRHLVARWYI